MAGNQITASQIPDDLVPVSAAQSNAPEDLAPVGNAATSGFNPTPLLTGASAAGGAGALYGLGRTINTPNRLMRPIDAQLGNIGKTIKSSTPISTSDLPDLLAKQYNNLKANVVRPNLSLIQRDLANQSAQIKTNRVKFDQETLNPAIDDAAQHIAGNYKVAINSGYDSYRQMLNGVEQAIEGSGQPLQASDIQGNLLNKTISDAIQQGVPEEKLAPLMKLSSAFENTANSKILDALGNPLDTTNPIPFSQVKGNVGYLLDKLPDQAKFSLADNWGNFMKNYLPPEAANQFNAMQSKYANFAQARNALYKLIDTKSGAFNTKTLSTRLRMFAKTGQDSGLMDVLDMLHKGSDITKPVPGLTNKLDSLKDLAIHRGDYEKQLGKLRQISQMHLQGAAEIDKRLQVAHQEYTNAASQTANLLSQKNAIMEKYPLRTFLSNIPKTVTKGLIEKAVGLGGKVLMGVPLGVVGGDLQTRGLGYDPGQAFQDWYKAAFGSPTDKAKIIDQYQQQAQNVLQT